MQITNNSMNNSMNNVAPHNIASLRHNITDAVYQSDDVSLLYFCFRLLNNDTGRTSALLQRLAQLSELGDGWDGEGSHCISSTVLQFLARLDGSIDEQLLTGWTLFPDARGYAYFDYTHGHDIAGITVAPHKLVAFSKIRGNVKKYTCDGLSQPEIERIFTDVYEESTRHD
jgi:hypothetical protein